MFNKGIIAGAAKQTITAPNQLINNNLRGWYRADYGVLQTISGADATVDAQRVGHWINQASGGGLDVAQTASVRPTFKTNIKNGLPVIRCTTSQGLTSSGITGGDAQMYSFPNKRGAVFAVCSVTTTGSLNRIVGLGGTGQTWALNLVNNAGGQPAQFAGFGVSQFLDQGGNPTSTGWCIHSVILNEDNRLRYRLNGVALSGRALTAAQVDYNPFAIGISVTLGAGFAGDIGEIVLYDGYMEPGSISMVEKYLNNRWAVY